MGVPAADIPYVLEKLEAIEAAIRGQPCNHPECNAGALKPTFCTHPLKLVRELGKELADIYYGKETKTIRELLQLIIKKDEEIENLELAFKIVDPHTRSVK